MTNISHSELKPLHTPTDTQTIFRKIHENCCPQTVKKCMRMCVGRKKSLFFYICCCSDWLLWCHEKDENRYTSRHCIPQKITNHNILAQYFDWINSLKILSLASFLCLLLEVYLFFVVNIWQLFVTILLAIKMIQVNLRIVETGNNLFIFSLRQLIINYVGTVNVGVSH